jgi:ATP-binding cassette subfamily C protein
MNSPRGHDSVVGVGGYRLDATRSQQVALARLVLADPWVAMLDGASSAGARFFEAAAVQALAGRTALVSAHRLTQAAPRTG